MEATENGVTLGEVSRRQDELAVQMKEVIAAVQNMPGLITAAIREQFEPHFTGLRESMIAGDNAVRSELELAKAEALAGREELSRRVKLVETVVYGVVALICMSVFGALIALVVKAS